MSYYSELCGVSESCFRRLFKEYTGQTVVAYLTRYRIEAAAELLLREDLPVSQIAELTGFRSESLFYQKFKEFTGMTPKAYQKQKLTMDN